MLTHYKNAVKQIGLTQEDSDAVLSHILSEYRRLDGREEHGVDWIDIISEILDERNIASKNKSDSANSELVDALKALCDVCEADDQYPTFTEMGREALAKAKGEA